MKISIKQYSQTLFELTENKSESEVFAIVQKFAEQLKKDGQLKNASKIMEKFAESFNKENGIVVTVVRGRGDLSRDVLEKIEKFVKEKYSAKEVEMNFVIDEAVMGGIIIKVGDEIIDGSVSSQLKRLQKELVK